MICTSGWVFFPPLTQKTQSVSTVPLNGCSLQTESMGFVVESQKIKTKQEKNKRNTTHRVQHWPSALSPSLPSHPSLPSSLRLAVGRQTTAPASVSAVAGTTAGIVEQGESPPPTAPPYLSLSLGTIKRTLPPPPPHPGLFLISPSKSVLTKLPSPSFLFFAQRSSDALPR